MECGQSAYKMRGKTAKNRVTLVIDRNDRTKTGIERYADELLSCLQSNYAELSFELVALQSRLAGLPTWRRRLGFLRGFDSTALGISGDIIHAVMPLPLRSSVPLVATVHDLIPFRYPRTYPLSAPFGLAASLRVLRRGNTHFLTNSSQTTRDLRRIACVSMNRITEIPLGIDNRFNMADSVDRSDKLGRMRQKFGLPASYFLYVGAMNRRKNLRRLIDAFAEIQHDKSRPASLAIAGRTDWGGESVKKHIAKLGLESRIIWLGYVEDAELPTLLSGAVAFVYPSLYEGFGFPILEAMRAGTLVICSSRGALAETSGPSAIRVDPASVQSIAKALRYAQQLPEAERARLISCGRGWSERYRWSQTAAMTASIYKRLLRNAG